MKKLFGLFVLLFTIGNLSAQDEVEYINPPVVSNALYDIKIDDLVAKEDYCKLKIEIKNKTNGYLTCDLSKIGFEYTNLGTYYPAKGKLRVISPGKRIVEVIKISGNNFNCMVDYFNLKIEGLGQASDEKVAMINPLILGEGAADNVDDIEITINKSKSKKGKSSFGLQMKYEGATDQFAVIDAQQIIVKSETDKDVEAKLMPKKIKILQTGQKTTFNGSFESEESTFSLYWDNVATTYGITLQEVEPILIHKVGTPATPPSTLIAGTNNTQTVAGNSSGCGSYTGEIGSRPVKVTIYAEDGACFQVQAYGVNVNPDYATNVSFGFSVTGKVKIQMSNGESFDKSILLNGDIYDVTYKIKKNNKGKYVMKLLLGSIEAVESAPATTTTTNSGKSSGGFQVTTSSSSTKTVNGRVIESKSSSSSLKIK